MVLLALFNLAQCASWPIYSWLGNNGCGGICMSGQNAPVPPDVSLAQVVDVTPTAWRRVTEPVPGLTQ